MRTLGELIDIEASTWSELRERTQIARNGCVVLPRVAERADDVLTWLQVTTRSPLGAIAYETGGLLIDSGWVRVLGSGCDRLHADLKKWNAESPPRIDGALIVAFDVLGGLFALDGGGLGEGRGEAFYFAPDSLAWEPLEGNYSALLAFLLDGDLDRFYGRLRWPDWRTLVAELSLNEVLNVYPPLFTREGRKPGASRRAVPAAEQFLFQFDMLRQLGQR